jgi:hypothetical protein
MSPTLKGDDKSKFGLLCWSTDELTDDELSSFQDVGAIIGRGKNKNKNLI